MMGPVPLWAEVAFAAVEDYTYGTAVVDGVMLGIGLEGQVKEPITWTMEGGKAVKIEGGDEAVALGAGQGRVDLPDVQRPGAAGALLEGGLELVAVRRTLVEEGQQPLPDRHTEYVYPVCPSLSTSPQPSTRDDATLHGGVITHGRRAAVEG